MSDILDVVIILAVIGRSAYSRRCGRSSVRGSAGEDEDWDVGETSKQTTSARLAAQLELEHEWWQMSLEALEALPAFQRSVSALADQDTDVGEVVALSRDTDGWVAAMSFAALALRDDVPDDWVSWAARNPVSPSVCEDRLLLRALAVHAKQPVIGAGLPALGTVQDQFVAEFCPSASHSASRST